MNISVITPTYNRAHCLPRLFDSLCRQRADFEWIIVDDGSTDDTQAVVDAFRRQARFPLRYVRLPKNGGKHVAHNRGVREATGELAGIVDSDDTLLDDGLRTIWEAWTAIPLSRRHEFCGVSGRCMTAEGPLGVPFEPGEPYRDVTYLDASYRHKILEERLRFDRLERLRQHPFPEPPGQRFVAESPVWSRVSGDLLIRYLDAAVRWYSLDGADRLSARPFGDLAAGRRAVYMTRLNRDLKYWPSARKLFMKSSAQYVRSSLHLRIGPMAQLADLIGAGAKLLALTSMPAGVALYLTDKARSRRP
ncbi:glycosyltransferase family 2 protein [Nonomuraea sediminis]|uniref:glycosyltransferase family 2 protein n=1 Tax=Nonomuraea sediminis TaxID=2835864 RepID=UPI001BDC78AF|nr:glycosyltransferase family 2 protein [Nonomuraea sediminis]